MYALRSLLPSRLSSFHFVWSLLYASPVFRFIHLPLLFFVELGPIAGAIYYTGCLLLTHLFVLRFCSSTCVIFQTVFYFKCLFYLYWFCSRLDLRVRRVVPTPSSSELSSHQMARLNHVRSHFPSCALIKSLLVSTLRVPLQLKGCTRTSSMFSPTTPSGASVLCAFSTHLALHFDLGVEQACSAAARVLLASPSRASPSSCI